MTRRLIVLVAMLLAAAIVFGAGAKDAGTSTVAGRVNPSGYPIVDERLTYNIMMQKIPLKLMPMAETQVAADYEKKTNIRIEWLEVPQQGWTEKVNLTLASLDFPDAMVPGPGSSDTYQAGRDGLLLALDPFIDPWMPNFKKAFAGDAPFKKAMTFPDGKMYGIPSYHPTPWTGGSNPLYLNKVWLDKLALKAPTTVEELTAILRQFKTKDPNGNGRADEIPLSLVWSGQGDNHMYMMSYFGIYDTNAHFIMRNGKTVYVPIQPEYKDGLKWFAQLYAEGLLDQESFTQNAQQRVAKGKAEPMILGSFMGFLDDLVVGTERIADYIALPPLKGSSRPFLTFRAFIAPNRSGAVISAKVQLPEAFMRWWDMWLDNGVNVLTADMGPEGQAWKLYEGERWEALLNNTPSNFTSWGQWRQSIGFGSTWPRFYTVQGEKRIIDERSQRRWDHQLLQDAYGDPDPYPPVIFTTEEQQEISTIATDLNNEVSTTVARFVTQGFTDKEWDDFVARVRNLKVDRYLAIYQAAYDRFNAAN